MAKESKRKSSPKSNPALGPWVLFAIASALLTAGWLMKSFPILIFVAIAPLFSILDKSPSEEKFWNNAEPILIALIASFLAGHLFRLDHLISSIIQGIGLTLAFVGYSFVHQSLGSKAVKFTILIFWLAIEYLFLKLGWPSDALFLADTLQLKTGWVNWTSQTGYLGVSFWILVVNLSFYLAVFKEGKINWLSLFIFLVLLIGPPVYSFTMVYTPVHREEMMNLYSDASRSNLSVYSNRGEFIPRTAAWISVLIFIFALVKNKTGKK